MSSTSADVFAELSQELGAKLVGDPYPTFAERRRTTPVNALLDLPGLRYDPAVPAPSVRGMMMRSPESLPVVWD